MSCIKPSDLQTDFSSDEAKYQLIKSANNVFRQGWSHTVTTKEVRFGIETTVRVVRMPDGRYHEGVAIGCLDASTKGVAVEAALSISIMKALKEALSYFPEMESDIRLNKPHQNTIVNISNIPKKKLPWREVAPPAQSTPKSPRSSPNSGIIQGKKPLITVATDKNNRLEVLEISDEMDIAFDSDDIDEALQICNEERNEIPVSRTINVATSDSAACTSKPITEEEKRLERKRKQREKQEEYKKQMKIEAEEKVQKNKRPDIQNSSKI